MIFTVLDHGFVELIGMLNWDGDIAKIARISHKSTGTPEQDKKLIHALMKMGHTSVFEHMVFTFHIKAPLFVARQWFRHRIGSFTERSGRYTTFEEDYYLPPASKLKDEIDMFKKETERSFEVYSKLLEKKVPKEVARMILPLNAYTEWYWTVNTRSLMNFLDLRADSHAQYEIQQYALTIAHIFREMAPVTYEAFIKYQYNGNLLKGDE